MSARESNWYRRLGQTGRKLTVAQRYYERGLDHFTNERWSDALADLDEALYHDPNNAEYYATRGLILLKTGEEAEAEEDFAHSLRLDATQWLAHYGRGMRAHKNRNYTDAVQQFSRAQHVAPERPEIYFHRAISFYEMGNSLEAIHDMQFAQRLFGAEDSRSKQVEKWIGVFKTKPE